MPMTDYRNIEVEIGRRIKERRKEIKLKQRYIGDRLGYSENVISRAEHGRGLDIAKLLMLADVLGVSPQWLIFGGENDGV